jgi:glycosyltransferase involved in cell wall biosynthesis
LPPVPHPLRWTSLGLALLEAMHLGMPVLALATTEASRAIPHGAGLVSNDVDDLQKFARRLLDDPDDAYAMGIVAREAALQRYGLGKFLRAWDQLLTELPKSTPRGSHPQPGTASASHDTERTHP